MRLSPNEVVWVARAAGFEGDDTLSPLVTMVAIVGSETAGTWDTDIMARSASGAHVGNRDHGLSQISNKFHGDKLAAAALAGDDWRDPYVNLRIARAVYLGAGGSFTPWAVFNSGGYRTYVPDAEIAVLHPFPPPDLWGSTRRA